MGTFARKRREFLGKAARRETAAFTPLSARGDVKPTQERTTKPPIGRPGDAAEQEADRIAHQVVGNPGYERTCSCGGGCPACMAARSGEKQRPQVGRAGASVSQPAPPVVKETLGSPGQPLDPGTRAFMEARFGHDFSQVRTHTDARAVESTQAIGARAYTVGSDIVFGRNEFAPATAEGRHLIAHELTHVVQQQGEGRGRAGLSISSRPLGISLAPPKPGTPSAAPATPPPEADRCQNAPSPSACEIHQNYVTNVLSPAVVDIGRVQTPYSSMLHIVYSAFLQVAKDSLSADLYPEKEIEVTVGSLKKKVRFKFLLLQSPDDALNGHGYANGDRAQITLNELSYDAQAGNLANVEQTMVHEGAHVLSDLVTEANKGALPGSSVNAPNLDRASYASQREALKKAVRPVIEALRVHEKRKDTAEENAEHLADTFLKETIVRVEAAIYAKQRLNQPFTASDLPDPSFLLHQKRYWTLEPDNGVIGKFFSWIESDIRPHIVSVQKAYLDLRR